MGARGPSAHIRAAQIKADKVCCTLPGIIMAGIIWRIFKKSAIFSPAIIKPAIIKPAKLFEAGFKFICMFLQFYTNLRIFGVFLAILTRTCKNESEN